MDHTINQVEKSANEDIAIQRVMVFLPYKASMWDSLESVWMAADEDDTCEAYVIPIPYFDRDPDGNFVREHYEAELFPDYVPITKYDEFDFGTIHPDVAFIHNPYDQYNYVTSVHPFFYSDKIKELVECLVYIPYFATAGVMSEGLKYLPSYDNADYIVIQSESMLDYYDERVPREKFLPFGSPKFDSVIGKCNNPPEPPEEWKEKMEGKRVFFYNTSLQGMLNDPKAFMKKMVYVFDIFRDRKDVCLLWRPHPLFESTLESMEPDFLPIFRDIRDKYIAEDWGIYDTTPCIEDTIALCDVYIGDAGTSVTSLFGVAGKPVFILNNNIHELPDEDDWKAHAPIQAIQMIDGTWHKDYTMMSNRVYKRDSVDGKFKYYMRLSEDNGCYNMIFDYKEKLYIFPSSANDILVIEADNSIRSISLEDKIEKGKTLFAYTSFVNSFAFIWPLEYPDLVILNMETDEVFYLNDIRDFSIAKISGVGSITAVRLYHKNKYYIFNVAGNRVIVVDLTTLKVSDFEIPLSGLYNWAAQRKVDDENVWLIPYLGTNVVKFNIEAFESERFDLKIEGLEGYNRNKREITDERLFSNAVVLDDRVIFSPYWGNKFVELNQTTGEVKEWISPFEVTVEDKNMYVQNVGIGSFGKDAIYDKYKYFYSPKRQWYYIDIESKEIEPFSYGELEKEDFFKFVDGFCSANLQSKYCCLEDLYNTLVDMIDDKINGHQHSKQEQLEEYLDINASPAGDCGAKVYNYIK